MRRLAWLVWLATLAGCVPQACSDADERALARDVALVVAEAGSAADEAATRLVGQGRAAIVAVEAGLYSAEPPARRRLIRVLADLGDPEAAPLLAHLARRDPDEAVRAAASAALARLRAP